MGRGSTIITSRLVVRPPAEEDRSRFLGLWRDADFMVFSDGVLDEEQAQLRFDHMLRVAAEIPFAKQPIVEAATGVIIGYTGVDWFDLDGERRLEFGYRLVPEARGQGYATEASSALLARHAGATTGVYAIIHPDNYRSQHVISKLGFEFLRLADIYGEARQLYLLRAGLTDSRVNPPGERTASARLPGVAGGG